MIYELRTYDLGIGKLPAYLRLFETVGHAILTRYATPVGYWFAETGPLNRIHHMWCYENRAARAKARAALYADADWLKDFLPYALPHLERQANVILERADGAPDPLAHPRAGADGAPWLYEFIETEGGELDLDAATITILRALSGPLSRRIAIRAFPDETAFAEAPVQTAKAIADTYHPAPFSALR